jgi:hypothetical protein
VKSGRWRRRLEEPGLQSERLCGKTWKLCREQVKDLLRRAARVTRAQQSQPDSPFWRVVSATSALSCHQMYLDYAFCGSDAGSTTFGWIVEHPGTVAREDES